MSFPQTTPPPSCFFFSSRVSLLGWKSWKRLEADRGSCVLKGKRLQLTLGCEESPFSQPTAPLELTASSAPNPLGPPSDLEAPGGSRDGQAMLIAISIYKVDRWGLSSPSATAKKKQKPTTPVLFAVDRKLHIPIRLDTHWIAEKDPSQMVQAPNRTDVLSMASAEGLKKSNEKPGM